MKPSIFVLILLVACAKGTSSKKSPGIAPIVQPQQPTEVVTDPLTPGVQQQQTDGDFTLEQTYNGANVVLNYSAGQSLGMIRIKDKDASKLHKYMALTTIKVASPHVKSDLEAKVGKNVNCREDTCWIYIDYKNGDVLDNRNQSEAAKAPRIILPYKGQNLELHMFGRRGKIFFEGMDAKALYSVMAMTETERGGKGSTHATKSGNGVECSRLISEKAGEKPVYKCEVNFNHRTGAMKEDKDDKDSAE